MGGSLTGGCVASLPSMSLREKASSAPNAGYPALHLEILRLESRMFRDARQHSGAYLFSIVEGEYKVRPAFPVENSVRTGLPFYLPATFQERPQNLARSGALPAAHAALNVILLNSAPASPCSSRSATTRKASA